MKYVVMEPCSSSLPLEESIDVYCALNERSPVRIDTVPSLIYLLRVEVTGSSETVTTVS
jgi:hypothetical protein